MEFDREISRIEVSEVKIGERTRDLSEAKVDELVSSILVSGLMNPIWVSCVRDENGRPVSHLLISGNHRLAAAKKLGWEFIDARIVDCDEREARLMEIAENLHRAELTAGERADQIAEWIRLTSPDQTEVGQVGPLSGGRGHAGGIRAAARELPVSGETEEARRHSVRRAVRIASIAPEAREAAREAGLDDNQSALFRVAAAPREQQVETVAAIVEARAAPRAMTPELGNEPTAEQCRFAYFNRANDAMRFAFWPDGAPKPDQEMVDWAQNVVDIWTEFRRKLAAAIEPAQVEVEQAPTHDERPPVEIAAAPVEVEVVTGIEPEPVEFAVLKPAPKNKRSKIGEVRQATPEAIAAYNAKLAIAETPKERADRRRAAKEAQKQEAA